MKDEQKFARWTKEESEFQANGVSCTKAERNGRTIRETVRNSEISLTRDRKLGQAMVKTERWLVVLIEGKNADYVQIQLSFFIPLWFLVGENKDREQCGVSSLSPAL